MTAHMQDITIKQRVIFEISTLCHSLGYTAEVKLQNG